METRYERIEHGLLHAQMIGVEMLLHLFQDALAGHSGILVESLRIFHSHRGGGDLRFCHIVDPCPCAVLCLLRSFPLLCFFCPLYTSDAADE